MKKIFFPAFTLLFLSLVSWKIYSPSATGMIFNLKMTSSAGSNGNIKLYYDTLGTRIEITASMGAYTFTKTSLVKKSEPDMVYQIDDRTKTYSTVDVSNAETDKVDEPATATVVGTDSINGYKCKHVNVVQGVKKWELWTTTSISQYERFSAVMNRQRYVGNHGVHEALKLVGAEGFPVKTILIDEKGTTTTTELISLEHQALSPSLFTIPADYKVGAAPNGPPGRPH